jgi:flagellin
MSLFVNTNVSSLNATRQLFTSNNNLISNRLTTQILGLNMAVRNANDGISLAQTTEGSMGEITIALQRIRVLAVQAQNGINGSADRLALQKEVSALKLEISRIAATSQFGGVNILSGDFSSAFLVGANAGQTISVNISRVGGYGATGLFNGENVSVETTAGASRAMVTVLAAISIIDAKRADLGALQNRFQSTIRNLSNISENVSAARSRIRDTDFAVETAELTRWQIIQQASITVLGQANQRPQAALQLLQG